AFTSDVRRYPKTLANLNTPPDGTEQDVLNKAFGDVLINKWRGPYLSKALSSGGDLPTGYGANITGDFAASDANKYNGIQYVTISISPLTEAEFKNIDQIIDETANSNDGQLRFSGTSKSGTATYYAVPIQ
ncbi:MAG: hypothetical protein NUW01_13160, partial [Gemmatimonadaceae bacterium]|nr:hypothetical protein [Gemmatimonadaceae bacterium]